MLCVLLVLCVFCVFFTLCGVLFSFDTFELVWLVSLPRLASNAPKKSPLPPSFFFWVALWIALCSFFELAVV